MALDLKNMQISLARYKVYNNRVSTLEERSQSLLQKAMTTGKTSITDDDLKCTNIAIAGLEIDDELYLKKTTLEFFHYARISIDILFQIINAALLGDKGLDDMDRGLISNVNRELSRTTAFATLKGQLDANKTNDTFQYLRAFDNYNKHIKTILISVKNSFIFGDQNEFLVKEFRYSDGEDAYDYPNCDALLKIKEIHDYVFQTIEDVIEEIERQLPNCLDNRRRIQDIKFQMQFKKTENGAIPDYVSFFIEVNRSLNELPNEIKVFPLIIKPNDEICSFEFQFDMIFIKLKGGDESSIIGCAKKKYLANSNEFYKTFLITPCGQEEYFKYLAFFKNNHTGSVKINLNAMEGTMLFYDDKNIV